MNSKAQAIFDTASRSHAEGNLAGAMQGYGAVLEIMPSHYDAAYLLAVALYQSGRTETSLDLYARAIAIDPRRPEARRDRGLIRLQNGAHAEALSDFDEALVLEPQAADLHVNRGISLKALGRSAEAIASYRKAIEIKPDLAEAHNNLGAAQSLAGDPEAAIESFKQAIALNPQYAEAHKNLGAALLAKAEGENAFSSFSQAIALRRGDAESWCGLAQALHGLGKSDKALEAIEKGLAVCGPHAQLHAVRGLILRETGRPEGAVAELRAAIEIAPRDALTCFRLGETLFALQRKEESLAVFDQALAVDPKFTEAHRKRGQLLKDMKRLEEALASLSQALALDPEQETLPGDICYLAHQLCDWSVADPLAQTIERKLLEGARACTPFQSIIFFDDPPLQLGAAKLHADTLRAVGQGESVPRKRREGRIRVAYFSSDFNKAHPMSKCIRQVMMNHDHDAFEIHGITYGERGGSQLDPHIIGSFDHHHVIEKLSDAAACELVRELDFDIAVDLNGFTTETRSNLFASRLAPVQVNFLGFPATMGASFIDYIIADRRVIPAGAEKFYTESAVLMPQCYFPYSSDLDVQVPVGGRGDHGLPEHGFVYCCFNRVEKITSVTFDLWMKILKQVPESVLWLLTSHERTIANLRREAGIRGVDPARLVFARKVSGPEHLSRHRHADLFLDTLPYNAHTTACDALWAGLPLVTLTGNSFAGRVATSMLHAAGLEELVTDSEKDFVDLAVSLAQDSERCRALRMKIERERSGMPLFDNAAFARSLEWAYREMHARQIAGLPPATIQVPKHQAGSTS